MVDFDEVRKEVAIKHGILLDENDPMLITITMNEVILNQYVEMVASQNAEYVKKLTDAVDASIQKGIADSKLTAGRVITEGGDYVAERVRAAVTEAMREVEEKLRVLEAKNEKSKADISTIQLLEWVGMVITILFVVGLLGSWLLEKLGGI